MSHVSALANTPRRAAAPRCRSGGPTQRPGQCEPAHEIDRRVNRLAERNGGSDSLPGRHASGMPRAPQITILDRTFWHQAALRNALLLTKSFRACNFTSVATTPSKSPPRPRNCCRPTPVKLQSNRHGRPGKGLAISVTLIQKSRHRRHLTRLPLRCSLMLRRDLQDRLPRIARSSC